MIRAGGQGDRVRDRTGCQPEEAKTAIPGRSRLSGEEEEATETIVQGVFHPESNTIALVQASGEGRDRYADRLLG